MADARSSNGTPLFNNPCPKCGVFRLSDRRRIGKPCPKCKRNGTHGLTHHPLYRVLTNMVSRCIYPSASNYEYYGGRGIKVCEEWRNKPEVFIPWAIENGWEPGKEIDRIDNDADYEPSNCRFVSHADNSRCRSNARINAETAKQIRELIESGLTVQDVSTRTGAPYMVVWHIAEGNTWKGL